MSGRSAACREGERCESADKLEMNLAPVEDEGGNGGLDEVKTRYHEGKNFEAYLGCESGYAMRKTAWDHSVPNEADDVWQR